MSDDTQMLRGFKPTKEFFIGIDSDGCVFDSMEIKHKECFTPMFVKHFHLQATSKYAREVWDFVNLYSKTRGVNRFPALSRSLNLLRERPQVIARKIKIADTAALDAWIARENKLTNATLKKEIERIPLTRRDATLSPSDGERDGVRGALEQVYQWSLAVNEMIEDIVEGVPPFPLFRECLEKMVQKADTAVISQTPTEALEREWEENGIRKHVKMIAGQELGTKTEHIKFAAAGKYPPEKILMIGDAPGDFKAAKGNNALFYPINPGKEEKSWERFHNEALDRFFAGKYAGDYEKELVKEFDACLPEKPGW